MSGPRHDHTHEPPPGDAAGDAAPGVDHRGVLAVRRGPGANCSSIGSAVEMLFLSATAAAAVLAAIAAAVRPEDAAPSERSSSSDPAPSATTGDEADSTSGP
jgi:hypothetical protein